MSVSVTLTETQIDLTLFDKQVLGAMDAEGAYVCFHGRCRPTTKSGEALYRLILDWHPVLTEESIRAIAKDGAARFDVRRVHIIHRCGPILPGEIIVSVAVSSLHRRSAFEAADYMMDRLKSDAVFWKREVGEFGERWIEPTHNDKTDLERWT